MPVVAGRHLEVAASVGKKRKAGLVAALDFLTPLEPGTGAVDNYRMLVEASHDTFKVVAIEGIEVAPYQFFFGCHDAPRAAAKIAAIMIGSGSPKEHLALALAGCHRQIDGGLGGVSARSANIPSRHCPAMRGRPAAS
jgi:hypothetical protein